MNFEGKKSLSVSRDGFLAPGGAVNTNDWLGVLPEFQSQIMSNTHPGSTEPALPSFTTTDAVAAAAYSATLMRALQNFFEYRMMTECGIPSITLLGSRRDWSDLRSRFLKLADKWMGVTPSTCEWTNAVDRLLAQFESARDGQVDVEWWKSIFKYKSRNGSLQPYITGHIACLFPWSRLGEWKGLQGSLGTVSTGSGSVPVKWKYLGTDLNLTLWSGFAGVCMDEKQESVAPAMGVAVTYDSPPPPPPQAEQEKDREDEVPMWEEYPLLE